MKSGEASTKYTANFPISFSVTLLNMKSSKDYQMREVLQHERPKQTGTQTYRQKKIEERDNAVNRICFFKGTWKK